MNEALKDCPEGDFLAVSALADLAYCERRAALHFIEGIWEDNVFTVEGSLMHERADLEGTTESRGDVRIARGLRLHSRRLGLTGKADVVEFHRVKDQDLPATRTESTTSPAPLPPATALPGAPGLWRPFPVEYKRGQMRHEEGFEIQLCAQALCLEEMLNVAVPSGAIFYGKSARRMDVSFDSALRLRTETAAVRLHELFKAGKTPAAEYSKKCDKCSLFSLCMPKTIGSRRSVKRYLENAISSLVKRE